jgi:hypothetical protein
MKRDNIFRFAGLLPKRKNAVPPCRGHHSLETSWANKIDFFIAADTHSNIDHFAGVELHSSRQVMKIGLNFFLAAAASDSYESWILRFSSGDRGYLYSLPSSNIFATEIERCQSIANAEITGYL